MSVTVCIATYRRVEGLRRLLEAIRGLTFQRCAPLRLRVVVIDNDPAGSASAVCEELAPTLGWPLEYHVEPRRGISYARNTAIARAGEGTDFIACVDDDEVPEPRWLDELLHVQRSYDADVVSGPVLPYFPEPVPGWVLKGKFFEQDFEHPRYETGQVLEVTATSNVLIRARIFREAGLTFDERLGLTGGEDIHFFVRVHRAGYKIVHADDALVYEWIPESRANARWILRRAYRLGNSHTLSEEYLGSTPKTRAVRAVKGGGRVVQGLLLLPPSLLVLALWGRWTFIQSLLYICRGAGMLAGLVGVRFEEYRGETQRPGVRARR